jgi:hypothetical protein
MQFLDFIGLVLKFTGNNLLKQHREAAATLEIENQHGWPSHSPQVETRGLA